MKIIKVHCFGTNITTVIGNVQAVITAIELKETTTHYKVGWFNNGEYKDAWLTEKEFTVNDQKKQKIGFVK